MTSCVETNNASSCMLGPPSTIPPPGAVCPAIVRYGMDTCNLERFVIMPDTRKTQVRGPDASTQALKLPVPESLRFVTSMTWPPRPPIEAAPPPCAPGKAGQPDDAQATLGLGDGEGTGA